MLEDKVLLKHGDTIQISKHVLVWRDAGDDLGFVTCLEPKDISENGK